MADSILRLRVESQEYDTKLKRASQQLLQLEQTARNAGESMNKSGAGATAFVQSLGKMETASKSASGRLREMKTAFVELSAQYNRLTADEKNGTYGQALSQSLEQLRTRIHAAQDEMNSINRSMASTNDTGKQTGGVLDDLAGKFGMNVSQMTKMGVALGAATAACKVAKDAFFNNEEQLDEWGRVVASSESLYKGFLNALNTGDISGFLSHIGDIISAARAAYDAIDDLATFNAFNRVNVARARSEFQSAQNDYREGKISKEELEAAGNSLKHELGKRQGKEQNVYSTSLDAKLRERGLHGYFDRMIAKSLLSSGTSETYDFFKSIRPTGVGTKFVGNAQYGTLQQVQYNYAQNPLERVGEALRHLNDDELDALQSMGEQAYNTSIEIEGIDKQMIRLTKSGSKGGGGGTTTRTGGGGGRRVGGTAAPPAGSIAAQEALVQSLTKQWQFATTDEDRAGLLAKLKEAQQVLDDMKGTAKEIVPEGSLKALNAELQELNKQRELLTDPISISLKDEEIAAVQDKIDTLNGKAAETAQQPLSMADQVRLSVAEGNRQTDVDTLKNLLEFQIKNGLDSINIPAEEIEQMIFGEGLNISDEYWANLETEINEKLQSMGIEPIKIEADTGKVVQAAKTTSASWQDAARSVGSLGQALGQLEDPSAKIAGIIGQAIANIALGFAQATAKSTGGGVWGWIAAIAGGLGTMISTIATIKSATAGSYAEGGLVPGNFNSGDPLIANVNSGELILNRSQQNVIASQLAGGSMGRLELTATVTGDQLRFALNNNSRRRGKGEYVTSK